MRRLLVSMIAVALLATATVFATSQPSSAQDCEYADGTVDCFGWNFDYELTSASVAPTGLTMYNLFHNGESLINQAHFAALPVRYENDRCGPYVDLFSTVTNSNPKGVQVGTFSADGVDWLEMGAHYQIGSYVLYNAFYFSELGEMKMRMFARGLQCRFDHEHWPMFVVDVDVEGPTTIGNDGQPYHGVGDEVYYFLNDEWVPQTVESNNEVAQFGHEWIVRDPVSTRTVAINYDAGNFDPPSRGTFDPVAASNNVVYTRQSNGPSELAWAGANPGVPYLAGQAGFNNAEWSYNDGETLADPVIVVRGLLDHDYDSSLPDDWHTSGISLRMIDDPFEADVLMGDVTCDGSLDIGDALLIAQYSVGTRGATESCPIDIGANEIYLPAADVDSDGFVDVGDALLVARCAVGLSNVACP